MALLTTERCNFGLQQHRRMKHLRILFRLRRRQIYQTSQNVCIASFATLYVFISSTTLKNIKTIVSLLRFWGSHISPLISYKASRKQPNYKHVIFLTVQKLQNYLNKTSGNHFGSISQGVTYLYLTFRRRRYV